jgi:hypothetical protein
MNQEIKQSIQRDDRFERKAFSGQEKPKDVRKGNIIAGKGILNV